MSADPAEDQLAQYLDAARNNEGAFRQDLPVEYRHLRNIDALFARILDNFDNPPHIAPAFLFYRCHSAFRSAVRMVMAGQTAESYMPLRGTLEFALYGVYFWKHPDDWDIWCARNEGPEQRKAVRDKFKVGTLIETAESVDQKQASVAKELYDRCIDLGAHPNTTGVWSGIKISETTEDLHVWTSYLTDRDDAHALALRTSRQVGLCSFALIGSPFKERIAMLGLWDIHRELRQGL